VELGDPQSSESPAGQPAVTRLLIGAAVAATAISLAAIVRGGKEFNAMTTHQWVVIGAATLMAAASSIRPLLMFRADSSEAFNSSEAFLVILLLTQPPVASLASLTFATATAQIVKRRPVSKAAFNVGQVATATGAAVGLSHALSPVHGALRPADLGAAVAGAVVFFVVNNAAVAAILVSVGESLSFVLLDGVRLRLVLSSASVIIGAVLAVTLHNAAWTLVLAVPGLLFLRHTVAAQFKAERDKVRVEGLFEATMDTNRTLSQEVVDDTILDCVRRLLRCPEAYIGRSEPSTGVAAPITVNGERRWLVAAGRRREEPFEANDRTLLEALAAVASGASTNAELYRQVRYERHRLSSIALSIGEGVVAVDLDGRLTFANAAASALVPLPGATNLLIDDHIDPDAMKAPEFIYYPAMRCIEHRTTMREDSGVYPSKRGGFIPVAYSASPILDGNRPIGAVIAFRDMTERRSLEDELRHQALHDSLTGLANRRLMVDTLESLLKDPTGVDRTHAVVFIDVDRFKGVNDSLGHAMGDDLLVSVSRRLERAARPGDLLARFGGDEFVALLEDVDGPADATAAARRMCAAVEDPIVLADGYELVATVSAGVALSEPGKTADDLLHDADVAMYHTKVRRHGGAVQVFDHIAMGSRSAVRLQLEADLRKAVDRNEIEVYYQPLCSLETEEILGAEALVRWHHPDLGILAPTSFIGLAEETGLIVPLGRLVLERSAQQARLLQDQLGVALPISVNLSPRQFHHSGLVSDVRRAIDDARIEASSIVVEITESMVMDDLAGARELMHQLRQIGVGIAVDDFGTGHSSLGYLKQFPIQELKIDRTFVAGVAEDPVDRAIVRAVVQLAEAMKVVPVAEGIETEGQLGALRRLGCPVGQGYHFARPLPAADFEQLVRRSVEAAASADPQQAKRFMAKIVTSS
jgi:diguanylate cyclase (GGDEF)-like protein